MLRELYIRNFVLIEKANLKLQPQLVIFSGETGAGKSMLLESIRFLLGAKASLNYIGPYKETTVVAGVFDVSPSLAKILDEEMGIEAEEGEISIKREMSHQRKSRAFLNGLPTSLSVLKRLSSYLIDIHSQDDQRTLLNPNFHRDMVDDYGQWGNLLESYTSLYLGHQTLQREIEELEKKEKTRKDRLEFLEFQQRELEELGLARGEKEELTKRYNLLSHSSEIGETANKWLDFLVEQENSPSDLLGRCLQEIKGFLSYDQRFEEISTVAEEVKVLINQLGHLFREIGEHTQWDPQELETMEERLIKIEGIEKKYHSEGDGLVDHLEQIQKEREGLLGLEENKEKRKEDLKKIREDLEREAQKLRQARKKGAPALAKKIEKELRDLGMKGATFSVSFQSLPAERPFGNKGMDHVEFLVSPNPGIEAKPLGEISSGGEMSRIMLALKSILSEKYEIPILFFDEIDGNIGGRLGDIVGDRLKRLAKNHQVFCITHLPQIAALGDDHFKIEKRIQKNMTRTLIYSLEGEKRTSEIAEMLQGQSFSSTALLQARELLAESQKSSGLLG